MDENEKLNMLDKIADLEYKVVWLENRYKQAIKAVSDSVAKTLPLDLQQKLFLDISKRLEQIKNADISRKINIS